MSDTWLSEVPPPPHMPKGVAGWARIVLRGLVMGSVVFGGLALLLLLRLVERPLHGRARPWTPYLTQWVCIAALKIMGLRLDVQGTPMQHPGAMVANHCSWLDIFVLNAPTRLYFVAKAEISGWPGIGWLARATGTVFIRRDRREAAAQTQIFQDRLRAGHRLLFFPEGTSTDGARVLAFKPTLFQSFFAPDLPDTLAVQPVSVVYRTPDGADSRMYGWWGDMDFGTHLLNMLAAPRHGSVLVTYHTPCQVADFASRKTLALTLETQVRQGFDLAKRSGQIGKGG